jgi:ubiquinone/menaquinone biosynthesis C-methylase UbiE
MKSPGSDKDNKQNTSWGDVADWYGEHLAGDDTYHAKVIAPNLLRIVAPEKGLRVLDLACGEGYFARMFKSRGAEVVGTDIAASLIDKAKRQSPDISYHVADATKGLAFAEAQSFDAVVCVLALQNMEKLEPVLKECARVLKPTGKFIFVLNHPAFRIPKHTEWGWDAEKKIQYRRVDAYLSGRREKIDMSPGKANKQGSGDITWSFHRSLQDYMKALSGAGFAITKIEEWISHKKSEKGPRGEAEDTARKEFPLFLVVESRLMREPRG